MTAKMVQERQRAQHTLEATVARSNKHYRAAGGLRTKYEQLKNDKERCEKKLVGYREQLAGYREQVAAAHEDAKHRYAWQKKQEKEYLKVTKTLDDLNLRENWVRVKADQKFLQRLDAMRRCQPRRLGYDNGR